MISKIKYKAIVFDMDGVIINSKEYVEEFWLEKLNEYDIHIPEGEREARFHGRPARPTVNDLFAELDESTREQIIEECAKNDASVESYLMIPGVDDFIKQSHEAGIRLGLVTSALPGKVERMLAGLSASNPFEVIVTANLVDNGKPDPECYMMAAGKMDIDPEKIIVFEDSVSGVTSASNAGATVIGVNEDHLSDSLKNAGAIVVCNDFRMAEFKTEKDGVRVFQGGEKSSFSFVITAG
ncbi:HAD family hydrolase [Rhodohalobacter sp. 8-1]|uniref:HAD family hydrolase n=1 Tax=Rhodohalobacter sp. 8-1 TaxID=3131972 RepID=UPI0030EE9559